MGQSTNAILFYGFCWDEETSKPWTIGKDDVGDTDDDDWEERYARARGALPPTEAFPDRAFRGNNKPDYTPQEQAIVDKYHAFWDVRRKLVEESGVEIDTHCSGDYPMPLVAIKASKTLSRRGDMNEIRSLDVDAGWDAKLREFCELMGIDVSAKQPAWWLVSDWN